MSVLQGKIEEQDSPDSIARADAPMRALATGQRVRVGLTGLAAIFLLVLLAAAGLGPTEQLATPVSADEPLAVLGVAPGAGSATLVPAADPPPQANRPRRS